MRPRAVADAGRVGTGSAKGIRLRAPGDGTRPLGDRVKQALFAMIESELGDAWPAPFLDLFAGSGAAGIEALSRGAPRCVLVERDGRAADVIAENLRRAGFGRETQASRRSAWVVRSDVVRFLGRPAGGGEGLFGAVLLDPPYGDAAMLPALRLLADPVGGWLAPGALVVAKHFWRDQPPPAVAALHTRRTRRFGETMLTFYAHEGHSEAPEP
ncbi:MAG: RsmD family RNA methyltransferase [Chloroflexi bacterium]|nr:RsmD family RNA methyltransferase [Chloroflexota bacterium]